MAERVDAGFFVQSRTRKRNGEISYSNTATVNSTHQSDQVLKPTDKENLSKPNVKARLRTTVQESPKNMRAKLSKCFESNFTTGIHKKLMCTICNKQFSYKRSFIRHTRLVHPKGSECKEKTTGSMCPICDKYFKVGKHMLEHVRNVHKSAVVGENLGKLKCPLCTCKGSKHVNLESLREHLRKQHKFEVETEEQSFQNVSDFYKWKEGEEVESKSKFVSYGQKKTTCGTKRYYRCHHSGCYRPQGTGKRLLQKQGSKKTGVTCSASIEMVESSPVKVKYFKTHCGHEIKLKHLSLTETEKSSLALKLAKGISMQTILDDVHNGNYKELTRIQLLTRKDLWNIKQSFGLIQRVQAPKDNSEEPGRNKTKSQTREKPCRNQSSEDSTNENSSDSEAKDEVLVIIEDQSTKITNQKNQITNVLTNTNITNDFVEEQLDATCRTITPPTVTRGIQVHNVDSDCNSHILKDMLQLLQTKQEFKDVAYFVSESCDWIFMFSKTFKEKGHLTPNINVTLHSDGTCVISRQFVSEFSKVAPKDTERLMELLSVIQDDSVFCGEVPCDGMPLEFTYG